MLSESQIDRLKFRNVLSNLEENLDIYLKKNNKTLRNKQ